MLLQIWERLQNDLGINFKDISDAATPIHDEAEEATDMKSSDHNISTALVFLT